MIRTIIVFLSFSLLLTSALSADFSIPAGQTITINLLDDAFADSRNKLAFSARMQLPNQTGGAIPALRLEVNRAVVDSMRLVNKGYYFKYDLCLPWFNKEYNSFYAYYNAWGTQPSFAFDFVLDISSLLKATGNQIVIKNTFNFPWLPGAVIEIKNLRLLRDGEFTVDSTTIDVPSCCSQGLRTMRFDATGLHQGIYKDLTVTDDFESATLLPPVIAPISNFGDSYNLQTNTEALKLIVGDAETELKTDYRMVNANIIHPDNAGNTVSDSGTNLSVTRQIIRKTGWVEIHDTLTNLTTSDLPIILDYQFKIPLDKLKEFRMAGQKQASFYANTDNMDFRHYAMTPLIFLGFSPQGGFGIYIEDKVFRNQYSILALNDTLHLADDMFYLRPASSYTIVLKLYPTQNGDYYNVLNTLRYDYSLYRLIPLFGFIYKTNDKVENLTTNQDIKDFFDGTGIEVAGIVLQHIISGRALYGAEPLSAIQNAMPFYQTFITNSRNAGVSTLFIPYLDTHLVSVQDNGSIIDGNDNFATYYADSLSRNGHNKLVPYSGQWLYNVTPTLSNCSGLNVFATKNYYLGAGCFDGMFFDEFNHSKVRTDFSCQDGYSAILNNSGNIVNKVGIVPIYTEQFLLTLAEQALQQSKICFANEFDCTVDLMRKPLIHFAEPVFQKDDYFVRDAQAGSTPLTLATTWKPSSDAWTDTTAWSDAKYFLRYGVLMCFYGRSKRMTGEHCLKKVFPIIAKEIYPGLVIGDNKIVTSRSGTYTFRQNKKLTAFVYGDPSGLLQSTSTSSTGTDGKQYISVTINSNTQIAVITDGNIAKHRTYTLNPSPNYPYCSDAGDITQLTDGLYYPGTSSLWTQPPCTVGWMHANPTITIDLGSVKTIKGMSFSTSAGIYGVYLPSAISIAVSSNGTDYTTIGDLVSLSNTENGVPPAYGTYNVYCYKTGALNTSGRYVKLTVTRNGSYVFSDEIEVFEN